MSTGITLLALLTALSFGPAQASKGINRVQHSG
jgi:hypothetical protein